MLRIRRHDLVARPEAEPGEDDVATIRRRPGQGDVVRARPDQLGDLRSDAAPDRKHVVEPGPARTAALLVEARPPPHPAERAARQGAARACIQTAEHAET